MAPQKDRHFAGCQAEVISLMVPQCEKAILSL